MRGRSVWNRNTTPDKRSHVMIVLVDYAKQGTSSPLPPYQLVLFSSFRKLLLITFSGKKWANLWSKTTTIKISLVEWCDGECLVLDAGWNNPLSSRNHHWIFCLFHSKRKSFWPFFLAIWYSDFVHCHAAHNVELPNLFFEPKRTYESKRKARRDNRNLAGLGRGGGGQRKVGVGL